MAKAPDSGLHGDVRWTDGFILEESLSVTLFNTSPETGHESRAVLGVKTSPTLLIEMKSRSGTETRQMQPLHLYFMNENLTTFLIFNISSTSLLRTCHGNMSKTEQLSRGQ